MYIGQSLRSACLALSVSESRLCGLTSCLAEPCLSTFVWELLYSDCDEMTVRQILVRVLKQPRKKFELCHALFLKTVLGKLLAGCYFPRGSVGIPHRKSINLTGNIDKTMHNLFIIKEFLNVSSILTLICMLNG